MFLQRPSNKKKAIDREYADNFPIVSFEGDKIRHMLLNIIRDRDEAMLGGGHGKSPV